MLGWIGNILILVGVWNLGNRKRIAFLFAMAGESLWLVNALAAGWFDLAFISLVAVGMACRNWIKWGPQTPYNTTVGCEGENVPQQHASHEPTRKARALQDGPRPVAATTDTL